MSLCPNCQKADFNLLGSLNKTNPAYNAECNLVKCRRCKLIWVDSLPDEAKLLKYFEDNEISHYNSNILHLLFWKLYSFEMSYEHKLIQSYKKAGVVLDIGIGKGEFLSKFPNKKWKKYAFDPYLSKRDIKDLKRKMGSNVSINQFKDLKDYPSKNFDVVILRNVIEHTAKFLYLIRESYRLLKKNGILFIRTPNMDSIDFKIFKEAWYVVGMEDHIIFFGKKTLLNILKKSQFKVKFKESVRGSSPLALFRSVNMKYPSPIRLVLSLCYFLISPMLGEGADFRIIAQK